MPENAVAWDGHDTDEKYSRVLMLAQKGEPSAEPIQPNEVLFAVEIPEGYGDVHPELLGEDAFSGKGWVRWRVVPTDEPSAEPVDLQDIEQYRMQMAGICTAALGYWKDGDSVHPDYDTPALREVAELYAKYAKLAAQPKRTPLTDDEIAAISVECAAAHKGDDISFARAIERAHGIGGGSD